MSASYPHGRHPNSRKRPGQLCRRDRRNRTGCVGITLYATFVRRARDIIVRHFYQASMGKTKRAFCVETLGRHEAFRKAVAARAAYERQILSAKNHNPKTLANA